MFLATVRSGLRSTIIKKCNISCLEVNGQKVVEGTAGIFNQIKALNKTYSTLYLDSSPKVEVTNQKVEVPNQTVKKSGIIYGDNELKINENWKFTIKDNDISLKMERTYPWSFTVDAVSFSFINFNIINTNADKSLEILLRNVSSQRLKYFNLKLSILHLQGCSYPQVYLPEKSVSFFQVLQTTDCELSV